MRRDKITAGQLAKTHLTGLDTAVECWPAYGCHSQSRVWKSGAQLLTTLKRTSTLRRLYTLHHFRCRT